MLALLALLLAAAGPGGAAGEAPAAAPVVTIDRAADADPVVTEASLRLRAELTTAGFGSRVVICDVDPLAGPADCPRDETLASISLARAGEVTSIFVSSRLKNGLELRRHVRVRAIDGGGDATLLAVRAVELLRDLQVEVAATAAEDPEDPKPLEFEPPAPPPRPPPRGYLVAGGSALFIPWAGKSTLDSSFGGLLGLGVRYRRRLLAVLEAAGPFANSLAIASPTGGPPFSDRALDQATARLSVRVGLKSGVDGPFAAPFAGVSYMHLQLGAPNLNGTTGEGFSPLLGVGVGETLRIMTSWLVTAELSVIDAPDIQAWDATGKVLLTHSGHWWTAFNLTAALPLF